MQNNNIPINDSFSGQAGTTDRSTDTNPGIPPGALAGLPLGKMAWFHPHAKQRIISMMQAFHRSRGFLPAGLKMSPPLEYSLAELGREELGEELLSDIMTHGVRGAIQKRGGRILGLHVVFDAEKDEVVSL